MPFSRGSSPPRHQTWGLLHCRQFLYQLSQVGPGRKHSAAFPLLSPVLSKSIPTLAKEISQNCDHKHALLLVGSVLRAPLLQLPCILSSLSVLVQVFNVFSVIPMESMWIGVVGLSVKCLERTERRRRCEVGRGMGGGYLLKETRTCKGPEADGGW